MFGNQDINITRLMNHYFNCIYGKYQFQIIKVEMYRCCVARYEYVEFRYDSKFGMNSIDNCHCYKKNTYIKIPTHKNKTKHRK